MKKTLFTLLCAAMAVPAFAIEEPHEVPITLPATQNNGGHGGDATLNPISEFASYDMGVYQYNGGGAVPTSTTTGEGIWNNVEGVCSVTLAKRGGAGGSGEAIVLDSSVLPETLMLHSLDFSITSSSSANLTGNISITLALLQNNNGSWTTLQSKTESLSIGSGASVSINLDTPIEWTSAHRIIALADGLNSHASITGSNGQLYTLSGITMKATGVPEPATATLSLLALAGLAARRRRH